MQRTPGTRCRAQSQPYRQTAGQFINVVIRNTDDIQALALCEECGTLTEYRLVGERDGLVILKCVRCGYNRFIKSIAIEILFRILAALKRSGIQALGAVNGSCADKDSYVLKQGGRPRDVDTTFLIPAYQLPRTLEVLKEILKEMAKTLGIPVEAGVICIPRAGFHGRIVLFLVRADGKVKRIKLHQRPLLHKLIWWISGFNAQDALMTLKKIMTLRVRDLIMLLEDELEYVEEHLKKINDGYKVKKRAQDVALNPVCSPLDCISRRYCK